MAVFKVGQRVKLIAHPDDTGWDRKLYSGRETTITSRRLVCDGRGYYKTARSDRVGGIAGVWEDHIAPLTDPKADAFVESLKKLAREPQNIPERVS